MTELEFILVTGNLNLHFYMQVYTYVYFLYTQIHFSKAISSGLKLITRTGFWQKLFAMCATQQTGHWQSKTTIIICILLILCCDWSDYDHMITLQKWYWDAISLSNTLTQSCQVHVLNSRLQLLKRKPTEVNWDQELRRVWAFCKIMITKGISKTHF